MKTMDNNKSNNCTVYVCCLFRLSHIISSGLTMVTADSWYRDCWNYSNQTKMYLKNTDRKHFMLSSFKSNVLVCHPQSFKNIMIILVAQRQPWLQSVLILSTVKSNILTGLQQCSDDPSQLSPLNYVSLALFYQNVSAIIFYFEFIAVYCRLHILMFGFLTGFLMDSGQF